MYAHMYSMFKYLPRHLVRYSKAGGTFGPAVYLVVAAYLSRYREYLAT